jgi:alpha-1,3-glucan synthase
MKYLFFPVIAFSAPLTLLNQEYNLNQVPDVVDPTAYGANWNHLYFPSPVNWRFPFYTLFLDRWADGDPRNNDIMNTQYEFDPYQTAFRHGGDVVGCMSKLDYLQNLGVKGIYLAGTPFVNQPWDFHQYNPLDFTLLDPHLGTLNEWRQMISEIHDRGMYVMIDLTIVTLGDLLYFEGFENASTPFDLAGYPVHYKTDTQYLDFKVCLKTHDS